jgi:hypothetical protein
VVHIFGSDTRLIRPHWQLKRLVNKIVGELSALGLGATVLQQPSEDDDGSPPTRKEKECAETLPDDASLRTSATSESHSHTRDAQISKIVYEFSNESDDNASHLRLWIKEGGGNEARFRRTSCSRVDMNTEDRLSDTASDVHSPSLLWLLQRKADQQSLFEEQTPTEIDKPEYVDLILFRFFGYAVRRVIGKETPESL